MRLNDAYVEVAHKDGYGFYFYKNSTFKGWAVRFERSQYDVEKVYLKDGQIVDDFEESEFSNYESNQYSEQSGNESV